MIIKFTWAGGDPDGALERTRVPYSYRIVLLRVEMTTHCKLVVGPLALSYVVD